MNLDWKIRKTTYKLYRATNGVEGNIRDKKESLLATQWSQPLFASIPAKGFHCKPFTNKGMYGTIIG